MYQNQGRAREPCSEFLYSDCFKMPKIVSKCPIFVIWLLGHHNYVIIVCFACLACNMDRFVKRIATPPDNPTPAKRRTPASAKQGHI